MEWRSTKGGQINEGHTRFSVLEKFQKLKTFEISDINSGKLESQVL